MRGSAHGGRRRGPTSASATHDPAQVAPRLGRPARSDAIPQVAGETGDAEGGPLGQPAGQPRGSEQQAAADRHGAASAGSAAASAARCAACPRRGGLVGLVGRQPATGSRVGLPACMIRGAPLEVRCPRRRRRPHRLEAVPLLGRRRDHRRPSASAIAWRRPLELGRVGRRRRRSAAAATTWKRAVAAADGSTIGRIARPGLRGQRRRPGRQRRPRAEEADRDPVAAVAPVDEQAEHLAPPQDAEDARRLRHGMSLTPHARALARSSSNSSGNERVVGDHADRQPALGDGARRSASLLPMWPDGRRSARRRARRSPGSAGSRPRRSSRSPASVGDLVGRQAAAGASARRGSARTRGRRAGPAGGRAGRRAAARGRARSSRFDQRRLAGQREVRRLGDEPRAPPADGAGRAGRPEQPGRAPGRPTTADALDDPRRWSAAASVRRLEPPFAVDVTWRRWPPWPWCRPVALDASS